MYTQAQATTTKEKKKGKKEHVWQKTEGRQGESDGNVPETAIATGEEQKSKNVAETTNDGNGKNRNPKKNKKPKKPKAWSKQKKIKKDTRPTSLKPIT